MIMRFAISNILEFCFEAGTTEFLYKLIVFLIWHIPLEVIAESMIKLCSRD